MTLQEAKGLRRGEVIHFGRCSCKVGPRGGLTLISQEWRVNSVVREWKRQPDRVEIGVKHGLYNYGYVTEANLDSFHRESDCEALREYRGQYASRHCLTTESEQEVIDRMTTELQAADFIDHGEDVISL